MSEQEVLISLKGLAKFFPIRRGILIQRQVGAVRAVDGLSFDIYRGETLGLVGESGCGKTTAGRTIVQLYRPTAGQVIFEGTDLATIKPQALRQLRQRMQMIFQDPFASLNPRLSISRIIGEPIRVHKLYPPAQQVERVSELLELAMSTAFPMNSQAASASASASPAPWLPIPNSSSAMSLFRLWMSPSRPRWSICWRNCRTGWD
jgi:oligopeptide transport system ATP-binding protein